MDAKENGAQPAYPATPEQVALGLGGVTKRELAAFMATQGLLSAETAKDDDHQRSSADVAFLAVKQADTLLAELTKGAES